MTICYDNISNGCLPQMKCYERPKLAQAICVPVMVSVHETHRRLLVTYGFVLEGKGPHRRDTCHAVPLLFLVTSL